MNVIFPDFKDLGHITYEQTGRYLGTDENGEMRFAKMRAYELVISHNYFKDIFKLYAVRDKKLKKIVSFKAVFPNGYAPTTPYTEQGFDEIKQVIFKELQYFKKLIALLESDLPYGAKGEER